MKVKEESDRVTGTALPAPVPGGSESVESLGSFIDRLLGDGKARDRADAALDRWTLIDLGGDGGSSPPENEEPTPSAPPPVPGGNESVTKGDNPPGENR